LVEAILPARCVSPDIYTDLIMHFVLARMTTKTYGEAPPRADPRVPQGMMYVRSGLTSKHFAMMLKWLNPEIMQITGSMDPPQGPEPRSWDTLHDAGDDGLKNDGGAAASTACSIEGGTSAGRGVGSAGIVASSIVSEVPTGSAQTCRRYRTTPVKILPAIKSHRTIPRTNGGSIKARTTCAVTVKHTAPIIAFGSTGVSV
jgi:hypothetical protein